MMNDQVKPPDKMHNRRRQRLHKVRKVMHEFKGGSLKSSDGSTVKDPKQAIAIALGHGDGEKKDKGPKMRTDQPERDF